MLTQIAEHFNYVVVIILMMTGLYVVFASDNMIKKLVGLSTFQTSVFLLYITIGKVKGGVPPIIEGLHGGGHAEDSGYSDTPAHGEQALHAAITSVDSSDHGVPATGHALIETPHMALEVSHGSVDTGHAATEILYSNPLPHVLILTAIVVGVATLAVGLALVVRIREVYGTIEEAEIDAINYAFNLEGAAPGDQPNV